MVCGSKGRGLPSSDPAFFVSIDLATLVDASDWISCSGPSYSRWRRIMSVFINVSIMFRMRRLFGMAVGIDTDPPFDCPPGVSGVPLPLLLRDSRLPFNCGVGVLLLLLLLVTEAGTTFASLSL
ncbi:hypothetical protein NP493_466g06003 [Ridgeia piscesae]|uniref:Uncharacterized protein n=1 Tax=Ridgeia piscesae TaxID=27915 RepID=A0AAD9NTD0_RIDPI|nr:hypothetical protein NP493_466g06003 [Ridgeia piscesae]